MDNDSGLEYENHLSNSLEGHISRSFKGERSWMNGLDSIPLRQQNGFSRIEEFNFEKQYEGQSPRLEKGQGQTNHTLRTNGFSRIGCLTDWDFELEMEMLAYRLRDVVQLKPPSFTNYDAEVKCIGNSV